MIHAGVVARGLAEGRLAGQGRQQGGGQRGVAERGKGGRIVRFLIAYSTTTALNMPASMWYSRWQW